MPDIKNIIFDLGGVIFHLDHSASQTAFEKMGITNARELFSIKTQGDLFDKIETGDILPEEFYEGIRAITTQSFTDQQIENAFNALLLGIPDASYFDILLDYKSRYRTFLLSNNNRIHYNFIIDYMQGRWNMPSLSPYFEKEYYSHLIGMRKPNQEIFEHILAEENLKIEETLFIDDSPQHIQTASTMGIHTYLKKQEEHLGDVLKKALGN